MSRHVIRPHIPPTPNLAKEIEKQAERKEAERGKPEQEAEKEEEEQSPDTEHVFDIRGLPEIVARNPRDYIQVPQYEGLVIASAESHKRENIYDTIRSLEDEGMRMPSIDRFMRHWLNLREAAQGTRTLVYADGTPVDEDTALNLWNYNSLGHEKRWWTWRTWLDALFERDGKDWFMKTDLKVVRRRGEGYLDGNRFKMERFLEADCYVSLDLNSQGFPTKSSLNQEYEQGSNFYFAHPRVNRFARFIVGSDRAFLNCSVSPDYRDDSLGVLACAEATALGNTGGSK